MGWDSAGFNPQHAWELRVPGGIAPRLEDGWWADEKLPGCVQPKFTAGMFLLAGNIAVFSVAFMQMLAGRVSKTIPSVTKFN